MALGSADVIAGQATGYGDSHRSPGSMAGLGTVGPPQNVPRNVMGPLTAGANYAPAYRPESGGQYGVGNYNPQAGGYNTPNGIVPRSPTYGMLPPDPVAAAQARIAAQQGLTQADLAIANMRYGNRGLRQNFGFDMQSLGLDRQGIGLGMQSARRGLRMTRREEEIMRQQLANSQAQAQSQAGDQVWDARSEATAGGAMTAPGVRHDLASIYTNLGQTRESNQLGFRRDMLGLRERRGSLRDQIRSGRLEAQRLGLSEDRLRAGLRRGLQQSRLDTTMSVADIFNGLNGTPAQAAQAQALIEQLLRMTGRG